jgi:hypothetical protein
LNRNANDAALIKPSNIDHDDVMLMMTMMIIINDDDDDDVKLELLEQEEL